MTGIVPPWFCVHYGEEESEKNGEGVEMPHYGNEAFTGLRLRLFVFGVQMKVNMGTGKRAYSVFYICGKNKYGSKQITLLYPSL